MADVYGRLTGKAGVCLATLGPGATNLVTGVADADSDGAPLVAITGQVGTERMHITGHQFLDLTKMFEDAGLSKEDHIITYCTGGIRSAYMQLVMEMCGFENSENYDESFYRWCVEGDLEK